MAFVLPFIVGPVADFVASTGAIEFLSAALESGATYAPWVASQIAQGALTEAGAKAMAYMFSLLSSVSPQLATAATQAKAVSNALPPLEGVLKDWTGWSLHHFQNRDNFGNITIDSKTERVFDEFQQKIGELSDFRTKKLTPLIKTASSDKSPEAVGQLHELMKEWVDKFKAVDGFLAKPEAQAMVKAGLSSHIGEINSADKSL